MKMAVFHLQDQTCEAEIARLEKALGQYKIPVSRQKLARVKEKEDWILAVTDSEEDAVYAREKNIAVIFYEAPGTRCSIAGMDLIVQGFEEIDVEFLQLVYMRHHGLPWIIAETEHLCIRESVEDDLEAFRHIYQGNGILDYIPDPELEGEEGRFRFDQYIKNMYRFYNYGIWTVIEKTTGDIIGRAGIENGEYEGRAILELGYLIDWKWQGRGLGKEAARACTEYAEEVLGAHRLYAFICPDNEASIRLIAGIGFERIPRLTEEGLSVWKKEMC